MSRCRQQQTANQVASVLESAAELAVCRQIPGYPRVDRENDYLISRFDGMVLDAKPWTQLQAAALSDGAVEPLPSSSTEPDSVQPLLPFSELEVGLLVFKSPVSPPGC